MALVNNIIPFSCVDGPGNRSTIFFQGCNFLCTYCHNPETINHCKHCTACVSVCPVNALSVDNLKVKWDKDTCVNCDACIRECKFLSSPKITDYSVEELFLEIKKISPFIQGITVSGGESTLNADFLVEFFKKIKSELNLTCFVDTNGYIDLSQHKELVEITDKFMLDVKAYDNNDHNVITKKDNYTVLKNLDYLLSLDKMYEVRTVIAPNINNTLTVDEVSKVIGDRCIYKIIKYRKYGVRKKGLEFHGEESPSEIYMDELVELAKNNNCINVIKT